MPFLFHPFLPFIFISPKMISISNFLLLAFFILPPTQACAPTAIQPYVTVNPPSSSTAAPTPSPTSAPSSASPIGRKKRRAIPPKMPFSVRLETNLPFESRPAKNNQNLFKLISKLKSAIPSASLPVKSLDSLTKHFDRTADGHLAILVANRRGMEAEKCGQFVELGRKAIGATEMLKSVEIKCGGNSIKMP